MSDCHHWLTLHTVRFAEALNGVNTPMPGPASADVWRFAPRLQLKPDGATCNDATWGGFALYDSQESAEAVFHDPAAHLPFLDRTVEAWHAIAVPYAHRGSVHWRSEVETDSAIRAALKDPKGTLAILTSAGFDTSNGPPDPARLMRFFEGVRDVIEAYRTLPSNLQADVFPCGPVDGREGCTMSLWRSDKEMMAAAYKSGVHKRELDYQNEYSHFDRSSFTRARVIASKGTWGGVDPAAIAAE